MMKTSLLIATIAFFANVVTSATSLETKLHSCSNDVGHFGFSRVEVPYVTYAGNALSVEITHVPTQALTSGKLMLSMLVEGINVASKTYEMCTITSCEVFAHQNTVFKVGMVIPELVPAGLSTSLKIVASDNNGARIGCVYADGLNVKKNPSLQKLNLEFVDVSSGFSQQLPRDDLQFLFKQWLAEYGNFRVSSKFDFSNRLSVFEKNLLAVIEHNRLGDNSYTLQLNKFAHLTQDEFANTYMGKKSGRNTTTNKDFFQQNVERHAKLPSHVDWTEKGAVTPVKNQAQCGSCWAFSAIGALESAYYLKTGKLMRFSEQEVVSCDKVDDGCMGGLMDSAIEFIVGNGGVCKEEDFPYVAQNGRCHDCDLVPGTVPHHVVDVASRESSLEAAIAKQPVSVSIEADQFSFQFYRSGVLTGRCGSALDHGVLAVGYGTRNGRKYFKVKNSWGTAYGMDGYVLIERGKPVWGGECGILLQGSYPVL